MPRRAQSKVPLSAILISVGVLLVIALGGWFAVTRGSAIDYPALNISELRHNSLQLRDNRYSLEGVVNRRERVTNAGQIISLNVAANGSETPVPVLIPAGIPGPNIESGYRLRLVVRINHEGIPEAEEVRF